MNKKSRPGRLRIVAGKWRSRLLQIADVPELRPTSERIRETLFNWLAPTIEGARCLDLYAGTGALGFEALSRGADEVVFVEQSARAAAAIKSNVSALAANGAAVVIADAMRYLDDYDGQPFDVVFLDPPFADESLHDLCRLLAAARAVKAGGSVYLEDDADRDAVKLPPGWHYERSKQAGNVRYSLVQVGRAPS